MSQPTGAPKSPTPPARRVRSARRGLGAFGVTLALTAGAVSACSGGGGGLETPNLKVGYVNGLGASTALLGGSQGDFSQGGLNVTFQAYPNDAAAEKALQNGDIDIALGDYTEFLDTGSGSSLAGQIQVVGEGYNAGNDTIALVAMQGSPLAGEQLSGSSGVANAISQSSVSVALPDIPPGNGSTPSSPEYVALANWAIGQNHPLPTTANMHNVGNASATTDQTAQAVIGSVLAGHSDLAVLQEPYLTEALETGKVTEIADLDSGNATDMPLQGYFALSKWSRQNPNTVTAFDAALSQAQALGDSRVYIEQALEKAGVAATVAATTAVGDYPLEVVPATIDNVLSLMNNAGLSTTNLSSSTLTGGSSSF